MFENLMLLLVWLSRRERCPWCGSLNSDDCTHHDGCPTLDTCGQFGPPWVLTELHADDPLHPSRGDLEPLADYYKRCNAWNAKRRRHLFDDHGFTTAA